jgi:hypothetical protein
VGVDGTTPPRASWRQVCDYHLVRKVSVSPCVANRPSLCRLLRASVNNVCAHEVEGQSADEEKQDIRVGIHDLDKILKIRQQYRES